MENVIFDVEEVRGFCPVHAARCKSRVLSRGGMWLFLDSGGNTVALELKVL